MMKRLLFITIASIWLTTLYPHVESTHIADIFTHIPNESALNPADVLVLFDLDNTIYEPDEADGVGSDQHVTYMANQIMAGTGVTFSEALQEILPAFFKLMHHLTMVPVEKETPSIMKQLQERGFRVMALTARSLPLQQCTIEQLNAIGIDFSPTGFAIDHDTLDVQLTHTSRYYKGVLFGNRNCKALALLKFFELINYWPKLVIFVDDKAHNIEVVETALTEKNIPVVGIRYGRLDHKVENFDPVAANKKYKFFLAGLESQIA